MTDKCYYNTWSTDTQAADITFMISDDINDDTAKENENKFIPSVQCSDSSTDDDSNGNTCSDYSNLVTCTDCQCDPLNNLVDFIVTDSCCSCEGGYGCGREQALEIFDTDLNTWTEIKTSGKINGNGQNCTDNDSGGTEVDSASNGCSWYKWNTNVCASGTYDDVDFTAAADCCACGGGTNSNVDNTASYPWITSVSWASDPTRSSYGKIVVKPED